MRKLYSLVLMAAALLIGTNAWATVHSVATADQLKTAWQNAQNGDEIKLTASFSINKTLWLGTDTMADPNPLSITFNLNGDTLTSTAEKVFVLTHGSLNVIGNGGIKHAIPYSQAYSTSAKEYLSKYEIFRVLGSTYKNIDAKTADTFYSHLTIGEGVKLVAAVNGIVVDQCAASPATSSNAWAAGGKAFPTWTKLYTNVYKKSSEGDRGVANGVRIDVFGKIQANKYAIKANGNIGSTSLSARSNMNGYYKAPGVQYAKEEGDDQYSPYIHIGSTAELLTLQQDRNDAVAAYGGGYARWLVEGSCIGSTGVYVKSGDIVLKDAVIASNYDGKETYTGAVATNSGVKCGGSGIVMESSTAYAGDIDVTVQGDTKVSATTGYAIDEAVTATDTNTKVDAITIEGGTFESGDAGTLKVSEATATAAAQAGEETSIVILGGNAEGEASDVQIGSQTLLEFMQTQQGTNAAYVTVIDDGQGNQTYVISQGEAPLDKSWSEIAALPAGSDANWTSVESVEIDNTVVLGELLINSGSAGNLQEITINKNARLEVDHLVMNAYARIVVKAGAKFIVKGEQGIVAPVPENIVLQASEYDGQAIFLFNPAVKTNRHPNATVEFISNSITDGAKYSKQRFGIPTFGQLKSMTTKNGGADVQTAMSKFYSEDNAWHDFGWINVDGMPQNLDQMADPFAYYQMQHNTASKGTVVAMSGELYGNESPVLAIEGNSWNGFANSYMAPIDGEKLIEMIPNTVDKSFQIYEINKKTDKGSWVPVSLLELENIRPMQAFLIRNTAAAADAEVEYEGAVYCPIVGGCSPSLARRSEVSNITRAKLIVEGEEGMDRLTVAEDAQFSAEFDNGYDAAKYMNDEINMYVTAEEKMGIFATDNLENTFVGFQTVKGGNYTIEFANVQGEELTLIDHETGAQVAMVEGSVYEFTANGVNDYRFEIVKSANAPTAIENTEAVKSVKGIYTITGQYVGEMNVWNSLPAGVYVVNGAKLVK